MFSIIIPLYNKQDSIKSTLESVLNQTFNNFEIIIVNDGSTDQSIDRVEEFKDTRIRLVNKKNGGVSSARNNGIKLASFPYIAFLDADDYWETDYLFEQSKLIKDFTETGMWGIGWGVLEKEKKRKFKHGDISQNFRGLVSNYFERKNRANLFCSSSVVIAKHIFETTGSFDEKIKIGEDLDMWFRIIIQFPVVFYNKTLVYYKHDAENRAMHIQKPNLSICLPYYVDKFNYKENKNPEIIAYIHSFCAGYIMPYYFGIKNERNDAKQVIKKLNFSKIKLKYFLFYKTPFIIGSIAYALFKLKSLIKKNASA